MEAGHASAWATSVGPHGQGLLVHDQVTLTDDGPEGVVVVVGLGAGAGGVMVQPKTVAFWTLTTSPVARPVTM
jgi:hypothetical protein